MKKSIIVILIIFVGLLGVSFMGAYLITSNRDISFGDKVAVIQVNGEIALGGDGGPLATERATPQKIKEALRKAERDDSIKAIVIEIDSPGGSVVASEEIADAIKEANKPTVAWLGEVAASGGYYVASASDVIIADRSSIVGSIGVISIFPEYSGLLQKIGVNMTVIKAGKYKDFSTGFRPMTDKEKQMMEDVVYEVYDQFIGEVAENRNLSKDYVRKIAEGRIYLGPRAKELGLVDEIGNRDYAIQVAARRGGIKGKPSVVYYRRTSFFDEFVGTAFMKLGYGFAKGIKESDVTVTLR